MARKNAAFVEPREGGGYLHVWLVETDSDGKILREVQRMTEYGVDKAVIKGYARQEMSLGL